MKQKNVRSNAIGEALPTIKQASLAKRFVLLAASVCALSSSNALKAQSITVDGHPGDWPAVLSNPAVAYKGYVNDPVNSHTDDVWTKGSKNTDPISGWYWTNKNTNDKTDLGNTGVAIVGHRLYFFADLHSNKGDAAIGFWLLKNGVAAAAGGTFTGTHADGDLLVSVLFKNGHKTAAPTLYKWQGGGLTKVPLHATIAAAATNSTAVASPWPYTPKAGPDGTYPANSFFEGYVNLDSINATFDGCFSTFTTVTWESHAPKAALADLVLGNLAGTPSVTVTNDTVCYGEAAVFEATATGGTSITYSWNGGAFTSSNTFTVNPATASGTVTVVASSSEGCATGSAIGHLVVNPVPNVNTVGDYTYCDGQPATAINFSGSVSGTTYTWVSTSDVGFGTSGTGDIGTYTALGGSAVVTTTVTVTPSLSGGCAGEAITFVVTVNPTPSLSANDTNLCNATSMELTGSPTGGTWSGYGMVGSTFDATSISPGTYIVSYWTINSYGCVGADDATITVDRCSGCICKRGANTVAMAPETEFTISPNPSEGSFAVSVPALDADAEITITNLFGQVVYRGKVAKNENGQQLDFNLPSAAPGLYYVQVQNATCHYANKIMIK
jgi:hypothetical protein